MEVDVYRMKGSREEQVSGLNILLVLHKAMVVEAVEVRQM